MGTYAKRESGETATSWPLTPTEILASSRRAPGSTRTTVCSFWLATTRTSPEDSADLPVLVKRRASREKETTTNTRRKDINSPQHGDFLTGSLSSKRWKYARALRAGQAHEYFLVTDGGCRLRDSALCTRRRGHART